MILDNNLLLDTAVAVPTTAASTNIIDLLNARDLGAAPSGLPPRLMCLVTTTFLTTNSATLQVQIQGSTDNSNWDVYAETTALAASVLTAGTRLFDVDLPRVRPGKGLPRYLRANYVVGTGNFATVGSLTTAIVIGRDDQIYYPSGFTVAN